MEARWTLEEEPVVTETPEVVGQRMPVSFCCGKSMNVAGGAEKVMEMLRHPASKRDRRDVYAYLVCETCGFVQRALLGHRPRKKR